MSSKSRRTHSQRAKSVSHSPGGSPDEAAGHRNARLEHILFTTLQSNISDATDPALDGVLVIAVTLSLDAGHARVAYAVNGELSEGRQLELRAKAGLARATGYLRSQLAQQLNLKTLPKVTFTFVGVTDHPGGAE